jgi:fructose-specific phosphotransferase system component IIB
MCGVDINKKQMVYDERFFKDIKTKQIVINKALKAPASLISRIIKYTKKGYRVSIDTEKDILRILSKVSEKEIDDAILTMY